SKGHRHSWKRKACFVCKSLTHLVKDCEYYEKKMVQKPGNPQHALKDKRVIDNGCSRHMTGNMSYLSDFEKINGGYVAFDGNPKGGKITEDESEGKPMPTQKAPSFVQLMNM
nr:ribonuclease H-like domain-containing protein [Tanacetum cinerariifolium]